MKIIKIILISHNFQWMKVINICHHNQKNLIHLKLKIYTTNCSYKYFSLILFTIIKKHNEKDGVDNTLQFILKETTPILELTNKSKIEESDKNYLEVQ